jgi:2-keto-3-deoxy-6-phosphogluconate aldolase
MQRGSLRSAERYVRFVAIDHCGPDRHPDRLIGSGTLENVAAAKDAAERMAERLVTPGRHGPEPRRDVAVPHNVPVHRS